MRSRVSDFLLARSVATSVVPGSSMCGRRSPRSRAPECLTLSESWTRAVARSDELRAAGLDGPGPHTEVRPRRRAS
jgi:hypothetical protein